MYPVSHTSAKPSLYNKEAVHYDAFNENNSTLTNQTLEKILKKYKVDTVLDLACGTGSQVFWLARSGYHVVGADINAHMLKIAKSKAKVKKLKVKFHQGDMRKIKVGQFDAVLTIFNAIGHLTKTDFEKALRNMDKNLKPNGLYIFDIFNLNYLGHNNRITHLTIDWQKIIEDTIVREVQYSTLDKNGVLASYSTKYIQKGNRKPKISKNTQTLQIYNAAQLKEMLHRNGFKVLALSGIDGSRFHDLKTDRIVVVARKK